MPTPVDQTPPDGTSRRLAVLQHVAGQARRILHLGARSPALGDAFCRSRSDVVWSRLSLEACTFGEPLVAEGAAGLASVTGPLPKPDRDLRQLLGDSWDWILLDDVIERLADAPSWLEALAEHLPQSSRLLCFATNHSHWSNLQRLLVGDLPLRSPTGSSMSPTALQRFDSTASLIKLFLDAGWLPDLIDADWEDVAGIPVGKKLIEAALQLGVTAEIANLQMGRRDLAFTLQKNCRPRESTDGLPPISVIVPVNRAWQFESNLAASPGLKEIASEILVVSEASSAAHAFELGAQRARYDWRLFLHQDVYVPRGSGRKMAEQLLRLEKTQQHLYPVGFIGLEAAEGNSRWCRYAGTVIDRTRRYCYPASEKAIAIDELGLGLHRLSPFRLDPNLGWHLWGVDLCLQAEDLLGGPRTNVLNVPLFHNSTGAYAVPSPFFQSGLYLMNKHRHRTHIPTPCGHLLRGPDGGVRFEEPVQVIDRPSP